MTAERIRWRLAFSMARCDRFERLTRRRHPHVGRGFDGLLARIDEWPPAGVPAEDLLSLADRALTSAAERRPRPLTFLALEVAGSFRRHVRHGCSPIERQDLLKLAHTFIDEARDQRARSLAGELRSQLVH